MRGALSKRGEHSWSIVVDLPRDPATGQRRQLRQAVKGTKREAEAKLAEMLHQLDTGAFVKPGKLTLAELLDDWLQAHVAVNTRPRTRESYEGIIRAHIVPALGQIPLTELSPAAIQRFEATMLQDGYRGGRALSARTAVSVHRVMREALQYGVRMGLLARNPCDSVSPPRPVHKEMSTLEAEGIRHLLEVARGTEYYPLFLVAVHTGCRRSELCALRWSDLDLSLCTLSVSRTLHTLRGGKVHIGEPKSRKGKRVIALPPTAALELRALWERQAGEAVLLGVPFTGDRLVFSEPDGRPFLPNRVTHAFAKIAARAGCPHITLHGLRHAHASLLIAQNVPLFVVSRRLGHSSVAITGDVYGHLVQGMEQEAAGRFEEALAPRTAVR
ncbi:MAG: site-specific integrase [Chloroflexi bacterium]|nr:site-specific integrase [Chloroflexota bacterium]